MIVTLTPDDIIIHQADVDHPSGVPATWAIVSDSTDEEIFNVVYREQDDAEPWYLHWRGTYAKCRDQYEACVTEAMMGDIFYGLPTNEADALRRVARAKVATA